MPIKFDKVKYYFVLVVFLLIHSSFISQANDLPPRFEAEKFGYSKEILEMLPSKHFPRAPNPYLQKENRSDNYETIELNVRFAEKPENIKFYTYLLKLYEKNPNSKKIINKLAATAYKAGMYKDALNWFMKAYLYDKKDLISLWNCAVISHILGDNETSIKFFKEYINKDPYSFWSKIAIDMLNYNKFTTKIEIRELFELENSNKENDKSMMFIISKESKELKPTLSETKVIKKSDQVRPSE